MLSYCRLHANVACLWWQECTRYIRLCLEAFGVDRCMLGSGVHSGRAQSLHERFNAYWFAVRELELSSADIAKLCRSNALRVYQLGYAGKRRQARMRL